MPLAIIHKMERNIARRKRPETASDFFAGLTNVIFCLLLALILGIKNIAKAINSDKSYLIYSRTHLPPCHIYLRAEKK